MSYSSNPLLPKARADAVRLLVVEHVPVAVAARRSGIHRTTLWRWKRQWDELNQHVQFSNDNRPARASSGSSAFRLTACTWRIPTRSSRPHSCRHAVAAAVVERICYFRKRYGRCAATVHLYDPATGRRTYLYTLVDVFSRWSYAEHHAVLSQTLAAQVIRRGEAYAGFRFALVQADNGPEYGRHFEERLKADGTTVRHSRVRRPNDNAYVERFNRTIQEECTGSTSPVGLALQSKVLAYLAYYNDERLHLGLQCRTPREMLQRS